MTDKTLMWKRIHAEREALAHDLAGLTAEQWATPSLCTGWTVQQLLGHMTSTSLSSPKEFALGLVKNRFSFSRMVDSSARELSAGGPARTLDLYRQHMLSESAPPGPIESWLGEALIHGEDIRRPLGMTRQYKAEDLMTVANFYKGSNLIIPAKKRLKGVKLVATDHAWSAGSGLEVRGTLLALLMTMVGRTAFLGDLEGEGVELFRRNLEQTGAPTTQPRV